MVVTEHAIANYLSIYLRVEPKVKPILIPADELTALLDYVLKPQRRGDHNTEAHLLECIGCIFVICCHFSMCPTVEVDIFPRFSLFLQAVLSESILMIESIGKAFNLVEPSRFLDHFDTEGNNLFQTFTESLDVVKVLLRDVTHQIRYCREKAKDKEPKKLIEIEPFHPQVFVFLSTLAIAHMAAVVDAASDINSYPGLMDSLVRSVNVCVGLVVICDSSSSNSSIEL